MCGSGPLSGKEYTKGYYQVPEEEDGQQQEATAENPSFKDSEEAVDEDGGKYTNKQEWVDKDLDLDDAARAAERQKRKKQLILDSIDDLQRVRLLPAAALVEAWPSEYKYLKAVADGTTTGKRPLVSIDAGVSSLVDISLRKTLEQCLESGDASALDGLIWLPDKLHIIEETLLGISPLPDSALPILSRLIQEKKTGSSLDLSGYPLTDAQISSIVADLDGFRSLNFSRNPNITVEGVRQVLQKTTSLRRLVLMNCPSITDNELGDLLFDERDLFRHMEVIMHPASLLAPRTQQGEDVKSTIPAGMAVMLLKSRATYPQIQGGSLPFVNPPRVVQGLTDLLVAARADEMMFGTWYGRVCEVAFSALAREPGKPWSERTVAPLLPMSLDIFMGETEGWVLLMWLERMCNINQWAFVRFREPEVVDVPAAEAEDPKEASAGEAASSGGSNTQVNTEGPDTAETALGEAPDAASANETDRGETAKKEKDTKKPSVRLTYEVHDLRSFLRTTEQEGYPTVSPEASGRLEELLTESGWELMTKEHADRAVGNAIAMKHLVDGLSRLF
jgi:hypothetical protein